jgi:hypothetical protein
MTEFFNIQSVRYEMLDGSRDVFPYAYGSRRDYLDIETQYNTSMLAMMEAGLYKPLKKPSLKLFTNLVDEANDVYNKLGLYRRVERRHPRFTVFHGYEQTDSPLPIRRETALVLARQLWVQRNPWVYDPPTLEEIATSMPEAMVYGLAAEVSQVTSRLCKITYARRRRLVYISDGDLKHTPTAVATFNGSPVIFDGWAWAVRFLLDGRDLLKSNFIYLDDNGMFICSDWCQRDRPASYDKNIRLYSQRDKTLGMWVANDLHARSTSWSVVKNPIGVFGGQSLNPVAKISIDLREHYETTTPEPFDLGLCKECGEFHEICGGCGDVHCHKGEL